MYTRWGIYSSYMVADKGKLVILFQKFLNKFQLPQLKVYMNILELMNSLLAYCNLSKILHYM